VRLFTGHGGSGKLTRKVTWPFARSGGRSGPRDGVPPLLAGVEQEHGGNGRAGCLRIKAERHGRMCMLSGGGEPEEGLAARLADDIGCAVTMMGQNLAKL